MAVVIGVDKGTIAEELGIEVGDELIGFNGEPIEDILDYFYYEGQESFVMNMKAKQGDVVDLEIEKDVDEQIGLTLDESVQLNPKRCKNKCLFCFVDQCPKGMRETLYVKDDDYRLSFVSGNYVTFTNMTDHDFERIVKLHLSPLYVSVHAYDKEIKQKLISNPNGAKLFERLQYLKDNGIEMHTQIVMCKDLNDKEVLQQTIEELYKLHPNVKSVAVVPVGMTGHRENLYPLEAVDADLAKETIERVEAFNKKVGGNFCWCSDEFYIKAGIEVPNNDYYYDYCQIENGVGLCREFLEEVKIAINSTEINTNKIEIGFITGQSFKDYLKETLDEIKNKVYPNLKYTVYDIKNEFFGESITVAGLITAQDIVKQVKNNEKHIMIPSNMLREFTDTFLDGMTVRELEEKLNAKICVNHGGEDLVKKIGEIANEENSVDCHNR